MSRKDKWAYLNKEEKNELIEKIIKYYYSDDEINISDCKRRFPIVSEGTIRNEFKKRNVKKERNTITYAEMSKRLGTKLFNPTPKY